MKRRITSTYPHPTKYLAGRLVLTPGSNLVEEADLAEAKKESRFRQQLDSGKVKDDGWFVDLLAAQLREDLGSVTSEMILPITIEEANALASEFATEPAIVRHLRNIAERGGVKRVFANALGEG